MTTPRTAPTIGPAIHALLGLDLTSSLELVLPGAGAEAVLLDDVAFTGPLDV